MPSKQGASKALYGLVDAAGGRGLGQNGELQGSIIYCNFIENEDSVHVWVVFRLFGFVLWARSGHWNLGILREKSVWTYH